MKILNTLVFFIFIGFSSAGYSETSVANTGVNARVPHKINFQSVFYDTGGNPLASGNYPAKFSILDQSDKPVYEEEQKIDLVNGIASVMIGDGFKPGSNYATVTGGIPTDVLNPTQNYFLKVDLDGATQVSPFQIVTVPFSYYSEKALSVAPGGVLAESLAQGIIEKSHLSPDLQNAIFGGLSSDRLPSTVVSKQDFLGHVNAVANAHPAEAISVTNPVFANSRSTNVGGVLKDLDVAIEYRKHESDNKVSKSGDVMTGNLQMQGANISLSDGATVDGYDISNALPALQSQINTINTSLPSIQNQTNNNNSKITDLQAADTNLQNQINTKVSKSGDSMAGILSMGGNKITAVADPVDPQDVATKNYVDSNASKPSISPLPGVGALKAWGHFRDDGGYPPHITDLGSSNVTYSTEPSDPTHGGFDIHVNFITPMADVNYNLLAWRISNSDNSDPASPSPNSINSITFVPPFQGYGANSITFYRTQAGGNGIQFFVIGN